MPKKKKNKTSNEVQKKTGAVVTEQNTNSDDSLKEEAMLAEALLKGENKAEVLASEKELKADDKAKMSDDKAEKADDKADKAIKADEKAIKADEKAVRADEKAEMSKKKTAKTETEAEKSDSELNSSEVKSEKVDKKAEKKDSKTEKAENKDEKALVKASPKELAKKVDRKVENKAHEIEKAKDAIDAEKVLKKLADEADSDSKALIKKEEKKISRKEEKASSKKTEEAVPDKKKYAEIMKTGAFVRAFVLMLIPGINIICVLLWAIGAARNKNKVHFSRACIIFFIIEIFLTIILAGAGYITASVKEDDVLKWADEKTNGLISYFEIDSYKELPRLLETAKHLKTPEEENPTEPEVPKTCYVYNPDGIDSYGTFMNLWNAKFHKEKVTEPVTQTATATVGKNESETAVSTEPTRDLFTILEENNVDTKESKIIYIIIDNDKESCVIAFDPTGKLQSFPKVEINNENIFIGGTK